MRRRLGRFGLRAKLALVALVLLALPLRRQLYVNEIERFLLESQEQSLLAPRAPWRPRCTSGRSCWRSASGRDERGRRHPASACSARRRGIWVVDRGYQVLAAAGSLRRPAERGLARRPGGSR